MSLAAEVPRSVAGVARGADRRGYEEVFVDQRESLLRLGFLLCGDAHHAEEAVAEAFAKVWPHWRRGRVNDERAYLRRALVNELTSRGRRRTLEGRVATRDQRPAPSGVVAEEIAERHRVLSALQRLPERQRAAVVLRFYADLSEADAAEALGMRVGTVKSQTSRGLARLRELLGEDER